jgi:GNAT superfamily N-acetyltransferase
MSELCIEPVRDLEIVETLLRDYVRWYVDRMAAKNGVRFDDVDKVVAHHQRLFAAEVPNLLGPRGRLLVARIGEEAVGVGALKPVDAVTAEIKRMYVRPEAQGRGIGRGLLERLLGDAKVEGFRLLRLETANFMTESHALYRSLGFRDTPAFENAETATSTEVGDFIYFMELPLDQEGRQA